MIFKSHWSLLLGACVSTQLYAQLGPWQQQNNIPDFPREDMSTFVIGDTAYACGGGNALTPQFTNVHYAFNGATGTWSPRASHPRQMVQAAASFSLDGKGYVIGGQTNNALDEVYGYDPISDTWSPRASFPIAPAINGWGCAVNGIGYVGNVDGSNELWAYDPVADAWSPRAAVPFAFSLARAFVIGDTIYALDWLGAFHAYDVATDSWSPRASHPDASMAPQVFSLGGIGYTVSGQQASIATGLIYRYDPVADAWTQDAPFTPLPRIDGAAFVIGNTAYVGGGFGVEPSAYYPDLWSTSPLTTSVPSVHEETLAWCAFNALCGSILISPSSHDPYAVLVHNSRGSLVASKSAHAGSLSVPMHAHGAGVYIVTLVTSLGTSRSRVVVPAF